MSDSITGGVRMPRDGYAVFGFYDGPVSVREQDGFLEVAFFSPPVRATLPTERVLDGARVRVTAIATRPLDPAAPPKARDGALRSITVTVIPLP